MAKILSDEQAQVESGWCKMKQEYKVEWDKGRVFFFSHSFKSSRYYAEEFIKRNQHKYKMILYWRNTSCFGPMWKAEE